MERHIFSRSLMKSSPSHNIHDGIVIDVIREWVYPIEEHKILYDYSLEDVETKLKSLNITNYDLRIGGVINYTQSSNGGWKAVGKISQEHGFHYNTSSISEYRDAFFPPRKDDDNIGFAERLTNLLNNK